MSKTDIDISNHKALLPVVKRMIVKLDDLFVEFVGPIGRELTDGIFLEWLQGGRLGPSATVRYAELLAAQLSNSAERQHFLARAETIVTHFPLND
jgi:hypothetical protein